MQPRNCWRSYDKEKPIRKNLVVGYHHDVGIPVVVALSGRADGFGFAYGFGARLTLAEAARSAIFELCQVELGQHVIEAKRAESGDGALNESDRKQWRRGTAFDTRTCQLLANRRRALARFPQAGSDVAPSSLEQALERLEARGIATYRIDLTRAAFGIPRGSGARAGPAARAVPDRGPHGWRG